MCRRVLVVPRWAWRWCAPARAAVPTLSSTTRTRRRSWRLRPMPSPRRRPTPTPRFWAHSAPCSPSSGSCEPASTTTTYVRHTGCRQDVLLAAGLDTRAFRLSWPPAARVWELDLPDVLAFKERVLRKQGAQPRCDRRTLAADLRGDWPTGAGDRRARSGRADGVADRGAAHLPASGRGGTAPRRGDRSLGGRGSRVAFEQDSGSSSALLARARSIPSMARYTSMFHGGLGADAVAWLTDHGWDVETHDRLEVAAAYGRAAPADTSGGFITATRR